MKLCSNWECLVHCMSKVVGEQPTEGVAKSRAALELGQLAARQGCRWRWRACATFARAWRNLHRHAAANCADHDAGCATPCKWPAAWHAANAAPNRAEPCQLGAGCRAAASTPAAAVAAIPC